MWRYDPPQPPNIRGPAEGAYKDTIPTMLRESDHAELWFCHIVSVGGVSGGLIVEIGKAMNVRLFTEFS